MRVSFRNGFYAGLLLALVIAIWLFQLWQPGRQVQRTVNTGERNRSKGLGGNAGFLDSVIKTSGQNRPRVIAAPAVIHSLALRLTVQAPSLSVRPTR